MYKLSGSFPHRHYGVRMTDRELHLQALQGIINRLSGQSFTIKGWALTVLSGFLGLSYTVKSPSPLYISAIPIILFWSLDGYYLSTERRYRSLYLKVFKFTDTALDDLHFDHATERDAHKFVASILSLPLSVIYIVMLCVAAVTAISLR